MRQLTPHKRLNQTRAYDFHMKPEKLDEELNVTLEGTKMIKGVEIAEYTTGEEETIYHLVYPDGHIDEKALSEVWADGNYTKGRTRKGDKEVMLDDDGIHTT